MGSILSMFKKCFGIIEEEVIHENNKEMKKVIRHEFKHEFKKLNKLDKTHHKIDNTDLDLDK